jgi:hypothetical protein
MVLTTPSPPEGPGKWNAVPKSLGLTVNVFKVIICSKAYVILTMADSKQRASKPGEMGGTQTRYSGTPRLGDTRSRQGNLRGLLK